MFAPSRVEEVRTVGPWGTSSLSVLVPDQDTLLGAAAAALPSQTSHKFLFPPNLARSTWGGGLLGNVVLGLSQGDQLILRT